jgi:precorrin-6B methylase 2
MSDINVFQQVINNQQLQVDNVIETEENIGRKLAPYNPTSIEAIHIALDLLELKDNDVLYDLGCGDGRLLIEVIIVYQS